jgi:hypothetical protein
MRAFGENEVRAGAATDTCSCLDALLLQSLFAGASVATRLAPAGRPNDRRGRVRSELVQLLAKRLPMVRTRQSLRVVCSAQVLV